MANLPIWVKITITMVVFMSSRLRSSFDTSADRCNDKADRFLEVPKIKLSRDMNAKTAEAAAAVWADLADVTVINSKGEIKPA